MTRLNRSNKRDVKKSTPKTAAKPIAEAPVDLSTLSYKELQAKAKSLGLKASGTKVALIKRIEEGG